MAVGSEASSCEARSLPLIEGLEGVDLEGGRREDEASAEEDNVDTIEGDLGD
jgi:hypothetical protein